MCYVNFKGSSLKINIGLGSELRIVYIFCHEVVVYLATKWALMVKTCLWWFGNNKGADQPAHPRSLISTFVIGLLESIISRPYLDLLRE